MKLFGYFCILNFFSFFVSLYKGLLERSPESTWETFSACLLVLDNLQEVFRCFIITDLMSKMFGFSKVFGC